MNEITRDDSVQMSFIAERAQQEARRMQLQPPNKFDLIMCLSAVHARTPLRLKDLYGADRTNFIHDIWGILKHIDRSTGRLRHGFSPRFTE